MCNMLCHMQSRHNGLKFEIVLRFAERARDDSTSAKKLENVAMQHAGGQAWRIDGYAIN